jgi:hypothetical protein
VWRYSRYRDEVPPFWADPLRHTAKSLELRHTRQGDHVRTVFGVFARRSRGSVFLNDSAKITFMTSYITVLFPTARFIGVVREGHYAAFAQATKLAQEIDRWRWLYARHGWALSFRDLLAACARSWRAHATELQRVAAGSSLLPADNVYTVRYERLCENPRAEVDRICAFIGVDPLQMRDPLAIAVSNHNMELDRQMSAEHRELLSAILANACDAS